MDGLKFCTFCGKGINKYYNYCPYCGNICRDTEALSDMVASSFSEIERKLAPPVVRRLRKLENTLEDLEKELDVFLAAKT
jgi:hypothetical protein